MRLQNNQPASAIYLPSLVTELVPNVIPKPSITSQDNLKLPILENIGKPESQLDKCLLAEIHTKSQSKQPDGPHHNENEKDKRIEPSNGRQ